MKKLRLAKYKLYSKYAKGERKEKYQKKYDKLIGRNPNGVWEEKDVHSFDVFDTLITRRTATPFGIFAIMQKIINTDNKYKDIPTYVKDNFVLLRHRTEFWVRDNEICEKGIEEITFDAIYKQIKVNNNLTDAQVEALKKLEIETETKNMVLIPKPVAHLKYLISQNKTVFLLSDMYYSADVIKSFLVSLDPFFKDVPLFVSSGYNRTKGSGELFKYLQRLKNFNFNKWAHYDDNYGIVEKANSLGICGVHIYENEYHHLVNHLLSYKLFEYDSNVIFGASKIGYLDKTFPNQDSKDKYILGNNLVGPALYQYVSWGLDRALSLGVDTVYFIARDGFVLQKIADKIIAARNYPLKTKYIYGSRKVWRIPNGHSYEIYFKSLLKEFRDRISIDFLSYRTGLDKSVFQNIINNVKTSQILTWQQTHILENEIIGNKDLKKQICKQFKDKSDILLEYLKQELNLKKEKLFFMELNGSGRTQDILSCVMKDIYQGKIYTTFFHTDRDSFNDKYTTKMSYYPFSNINPNYLELLTTANHGQTIAYKKEKGKVVPVLEKINESWYEQWNYSWYLDGILDFSKNMLQFEAINKTIVNSLNTYWDICNFFINCIDKKTAKLVGTRPAFAALGNESKIIESIPAYSWKDVWQYIWNKKERLFLNNVAMARTSKKKLEIINFWRKRSSLKTKLLRLCSVRKESDSSCIKVCLLGIGLRVNLNKYSFCMDTYYLWTLFKFLLKKKKKEKLSQVANVRFLTFRDPLPNGGGGGQGAALSMNKAILPEYLNGHKIQYTFEIPNKYSGCLRWSGPNLEFSGIQFAFEQTANDENTIYLTHEETTACGLWLMGKNYIMCSHIQGSRCEEMQNFGNKLSLISRWIIRFCERQAMKHAYCVCYPADGAYKYFLNSKHKSIMAEEFKKGPVLYNTLYAKVEEEQYADLVKDPSYLTVMTSGSLTIAKGVDRSLYLVEKLLEKTTRKVRYIFVGEGVLAKMVDDKLEELKAKYANFSYVRVNRCSDGQMPYLQSLCDVFIVLHRIAIFDLSTLEMMNKAKAIVLSDVGGNPEFNVENNMIMWSEQKENYDEIAEKILNSDLAELGKINKKIYDKYFGPKPYVEAYKELIKDFEQNVMDIAS